MEGGGETSSGACANKYDKCRARIRVSTTRVGSNTAAMAIE